MQFSLAPWHWRLRPRWWLDDYTWYCEAEWLFLTVTLFTNGGRKRHG